MRVVAGRFGGRTLAGPRGNKTRPTSDKVREALFSILGPIDDAKVLDLFAGTGALGIESLSRGAAAATFVESDRQMVSVIEQNLDAIVGDEAKASVVKADAVRWSTRAAGDQSFDLIFLDPPYADAGRLAPKLAPALSELLASGGTIVAECDRRSPLLLENTQSDGQTGLSLRSERKYGDTLIRIFDGA